MDNKLYDIVKLTALKYGLNHKLIIHAAKIDSRTTASKTSFVFPTFIFKKSFGNLNT